MTARDKDRILAEIKAYKPHYEIEGLAEVLPELEAEGYVDVWWDEQHKPIRVKLSHKGKYFIENGGYAKRNKKQFTASTKRLISRIAEGVAIALLSGYLGWLLKGWTLHDNTAPSQAEPIEQKSRSADSVGLSNDASLLLKQDSVASRAKSRAVISESSANTRLIHSTCIPSKDMSARHCDNNPSAPAVGYKSVPSGK